MREHERRKEKDVNSMYVQYVDSRKGAGSLGINRLAAMLD
jgi:hypothetical protein